jgi:hypothetical protein
LRKKSAIENFCHADLHSTEPIEGSRIMSVLPTHRDASPSSSSAPAQASSSASSSSINGGSTRVGSEEEPNNLAGGEKHTQGAGKLVKESNGKEYVEKGLMEMDEDGQKRKVMLVVEQKSGREMFKEVGGGEYTQPRW